MEEVIEFEVEDKRYRLLFQGKEYPDYKLEKYYKENSVGGKKVEFLPGIFYSIVVIKPKGIKTLVLRILEKNKKRYETFKRFIDLLLERCEVYLVSITFDNARDDYSLYIDDTLIINHEKNYTGKELFIEKKDYEYLGGEPEYIEVETEKILFPHQSGGDGLRCSLKGVFQSMDLFRTDTYNAHYFFFDEYEMHCLAMHSEKVRQICKKCRNCMRTVELMREGKFIGPTKGNDSDCLKLGKCGDRYIIENGNHRACCAKVFGIPTVKAKVYKYEKIKDEQDNNKQTQEFNYMKREFDNKDVLNSFYGVFRNKGISDDEAREYLKQDGTDSRLIELLQI